MGKHHSSRRISPTRATSLVVFIAWSTSICAADLSIRIEDKNQVSVEDTVIELLGQAGNAFTAQAVEITQEGKEFSPELSVVGRGSTILFTNNDPFQHHVYSVSRGNQFDLPLYQGTPARLIEFDNQGVVKLGCNIHDWMLGFVYVAESQQLVIADASGRTRFSNLPAGDYQLRIWNPRLRNNKKVITRSIRLEENDHLDQTIAVSLRKEIRKPPRPQNNNGYDY